MYSHTRVLSLQVRAGPIRMRSSVPPPSSALLHAPCPSATLRPSARVAGARQRVTAAWGGGRRGPLLCAASAAAPAVARPVAEAHLEAQVAVVLGSQWGDEGKGKLVDILAHQYDIVARAQVPDAPSSSDLLPLLRTAHC